MFSPPCGNATTIGQSPPGHTLNALSNSAEEDGHYVQQLLAQLVKKCQLYQAF